MITIDTAIHKYSLVVSHITTALCDKLIIYLVA
jgi:hypothetical protein